MNKCFLGIILKRYKNKLWSTTYIIFSLKWLELSLTRHNHHNKLEFNVYINGVKFCKSCQCLTFLYLNLVSSLFYN